MQPPPDCRGACCYIPTSWTLLEIRKGIQLAGNPTQPTLCFARPPARDVQTLESPAVTFGHSTQSTLACVNSPLSETKMLPSHTSKSSRVFQDSIGQILHKNNVRFLFFRCPACASLAHTTLF